MSTGMPADEDLMARHQRTNAEAKKWREAAETAISEATVLGAELEALRRRHDSLRKRKEAREERHHHDALSLAASQAAEAVKVRLTNQEAMARARAERRRLQEELELQRAATERREQEVNEFARAAADAVGAATKRASAILRTALPCDATILRSSFSCDLKQMKGGMRTGKIDSRPLCDSHRAEQRQFLKAKVALRNSTRKLCRRLLLRRRSRPQNFELGKGVPNNYVLIRRNCVEPEQEQQARRELCFVPAPSRVAVDAISQMD
ncbi:unnamed protein product [Polarella glacialis]|uniref:Uncharacterized protein n=1 Tax=Polarella glacialis TaxID=89957 RepID=A0A813GSI2_POLGL|nr:unnamed protein product [Polarella glacialis]